LLEFGRIPNTTGWLPGDLLLTRVAKEPPESRFTRFIVAAQERQFKMEDARWSHAAVYAGDDHIVEAEFDKTAAARVGVIISHISNCVPEQIIRVRRDQRLTAANRDHIVARARSLVGEGYSLRRAFELWVNLQAEKHDIRIPHISSEPKYYGTPRGGVVCSDIFAIAYGEATLRHAAPAARRYVTPAALSHSRNFEDLPLCWRPLALPRDTAGIS
jgi:hypothetical protein